MIEAIQNGSFSAFGFYIISGRSSPLQMIKKNPKGHTVTFPDLCVPFLHIEDAPMARPLIIYNLTRSSLSFATRNARGVV